MLYLKNKYLFWLRKEAIIGAWSGIKKRFPTASLKKPRE